MGKGIAVGIYACRKAAMMHGAQSRRKNKIRDANLPRGGAVGFNTQVYM